MPSADHGSSTGRRNSLGLSQKEIEVLLDRFDASGGGASPNREFTRWKFRLERVIMKTSHPGGSVVEIPVVCRNLSSGGVGVLHCNYVHPGSEVTVALEVAGATASKEIPGVVRRCVHREGKIHDIGIEFKQSINVREVLGLDILSDCFSRETIDSEQLTGNVVHIEPSTLDRKILQHYLRSTSITLRQAETGEQGLELARNPTDLIIISDELEDPSPFDFVMQLRAEGLAVPIVLVASNASPHTATIASSLKLSAMLTKPIGQDLLMRALAEFLMSGASKADGSEAGAQAVAAMVERLKALGQQLNEALGANDAEATLTAVGQIRSVGRRAGFESVANLADKAHDELDASQNVEECIGVLLELSTASEQARPGQAA